MLGAVRGVELDVGGEVGAWRRVGSGLSGHREREGKGEWDWHLVPHGCTL